MDWGTGISHVNAYIVPKEEQIVPLCLVTVGKMRGNNDYDRPELTSLAGLGKDVIPDWKVRSLCKKQRYQRYRGMNKKLGGKKSWSICTIM